LVDRLANPRGLHIGLAALCAKRVLPSPQAPDGRSTQRTDRHQTQRMATGLIMACTAP